MITIEISDDSILFLIYFLTFCFGFGWILVNIVLRYDAQKIKEKMAKVREQ